MSSPTEASIIYSDQCVETEWWYYHGHLQTDAGEFSFHLVFFRRNTDKIRIGRVIHGRHFCDNAWFAHLSVCDLQNSTFHYAQRRSNGGICNNAHRVWVADWSAQESDDIHYLRAQSNMYRINLSLHPTKPIANNHHGDTFSKIPDTEIQYHTITRMDITGKIEIEGKQLTATGTAWMDCERGPFKFNQHLHGWDWFAIQTNNHHELMIYRMRDAAGQTTPHSMAVMHYSDGHRQISQLDHWHITPTGFWTSDQTGNCYPIHWHIREDSLGIDMELHALINHSEIDARGSACTIYWEGPALTKGKILNQPTQAQAYMELAGYNDTCRIGEYDYTRDNLPLIDWLYCSARYFCKRNGITMQP